MTDREAAKFHADFYEPDSNFFFDLPMKGGSRRFGALFDSTTWKSNLARPRVPLSLRPLHEERLQPSSRLLPEKNRDHCFHSVPVF